MAGEGDRRPDDIAYLTALVRSHDRPRYYATLFAPAARRADLFALYGFAAEIARIPDLVSEPGLGEIRLKWWQEALASAAYAPGTGDTPAIRALSGAISDHALPLAAFEAMLEASAFTLYADPPATLTDLEGRLGETESALFQLAALIMGADAPASADAAGHAGVAYGLARRLAVFASERARGRTMLPAELLTGAGLSPDDIYAQPPPAALGGPVATLVEVARGHLAQAGKHLAALPAELRPVFLPLAVARPLLERAERLGPAISQKDAGLSDIESLIRVAWAQLTRMGIRRTARS